MCQTKESNKRAPGRVVIYIRVHSALIYTLACNNVLLVLALNFMVHKSSYCKCSLAWCQVRTFLLFTIWIHPLQVRQYPLRYADTDRIKKSHFNWVFTSVIQSPRFTNDHKFGISVSTLSVVDIPTQILLTILLFIDCSKMVRIRINTRTHTKEKPYLKNSYFFQNW